MPSQKISNIIFAYTFPICFTHLYHLCDQWFLSILQDWPFLGVLLYEKWKATPSSAFLFPKSFCCSLDDDYCNEKPNIGKEGSSWNFKHYPALLDASVMLFRYWISLLVGRLLHNLHLNRDSIWFQFTEIKVACHTSHQKLSNPEVPQVSLIHTNLELYYTSFDASEGKDNKDSVNDSFVLLYL